MPAKILLVDDIREIRELVRSILELSGYTVVPAANSAEAVDRARRESFDLLLSDIVMPAGDGLQLAREVRMLQPCIRVMLMTGFPEEILVLDSGWTLIKKPFLATELMAKVRSVLEAPPLPLPA